MKETAIGRKYSRVFVVIVDKSPYALILSVFLAIILIEYESRIPRKFNSTEYVTNIVILETTNLFRRVLGG